MANERWQVTGDYFENCNCDVVCPCLVSTAAPLTSRPTQGACDVALVIHIDKGRYGSVVLDGLNAVVAAHTPGPMGNGNWTVAAYVDERANDEQTQALAQILGGGAGGPMAAFAPLIATNLGAKKVRIDYRVDGKKRSAEIPGVMSMAVRPLASLRADGGEIWAATGVQSGQARARRRRQRQHVQRSRNALGQLPPQRPLRADQLVELTVGDARIAARNTRRTSDAPTRLGSIVNANHDGSPLRKCACTSTSSP